MAARLVTGYVPIKDHPRTPDVYGALGEKLGGVPVRKKAFYELVDQTWLYKLICSLSQMPSPSAGDNPAKNTLLYHCVQHQKTEWLMRAAEEYDDDVFVWVDYGIFHQPGVNNEAIYNFMESLDDKAIYAPGCWDKPDVVEASYPCWRFCGSVLAVPRAYVKMLHFNCVRTVMKHVVDTRNIEWEVNTWARVEKNTGAFSKRRHLPWCWYKADHDVTQFTNVPTLKVSDAV